MKARLFLRLLLAFALAFAGSAAQLHALGHAQADLLSASSDPAPKAPAPLKHSSDQCLVVHALDGTAAESSSVLLTADVTNPVLPVAYARSGESPATAFQSRAPPFLS